MRFEEAREFPHRDAVWFLRVLGIVVFLALLLSLLIFPVSAGGWFWVNLGMSGIALSLVVWSFLHPWNSKSGRVTDSIEQMQERMRKQNAMLVKLATHDAVRNGEFQEAVQYFTSEVAEAMGADRVAIWKYMRKDQYLICDELYFHGSNKHENGSIVSATDNPVYFEQVATERVIQIPDAGHHPLTKNFKLPYGSEEVIRNALDVPLRIGGKLHGVLSAERDGQDKGWDLEDQQFLASVGDLLATFFETNERRRAKTELANSLALLKAVFESTGVGILVTDAGRKVIDCNKTYLSIFGLDRDFLMNGNPDEVIAYCRAQTMDVAGAAKSKKFLTEHPHENLLENLFFRDGRVVERFTEVLQVEDDVIGRVWFYRDVTERARAAAAILESQQRNKSIIEAIPDIMLRIQIDGQVLDLKVPESGPLSHLVANQEKVHLTSLFPADFVGEMLLYAKKAIQVSGVVEYETELLVDGNTKDFEARLTPSGHEEALLMLRDVTERKKMERELRQRNHELDSFVYRASHDLKAPLNSLMGLIEILKSESSEAALAPYFDLMDKSVLKLDTFIRNLTDFSKIARLEIRNQAVDFSHIIDDVLEGLQYMENADRVRKVVEIMPGVAYFGDGFHLGIVLGNLISNAVKYQDLGKLDAEVRIRVETSREECVIYVSDNGLGIPKIHQSRIFELFYRASNQSFGSGLGLYITRNAVEKMKGVIEMHSEQGFGTTFTVTLPNAAVLELQPAVGLRATGAV